MIIANIVALSLIVIGALNWGLIGIFQFNLVQWITMGFNGWAIAIYVIVLLAAIWLIVSAIMSRGAIYLCKNREDREKK